MLQCERQKSSLKETFLVASMERKRTTATVVCLTFATIPNVFASVRLLPSLFPLAPSPLCLLSSTLRDFRSDSSLFLFLTSIFFLLSQTNKLQAELELQAWTRLARLDGTFSNLQMQFSNSFYRSFRGPRLSDWPECNFIPRDIKYPPSRTMNS